MKIYNLIHFEFFSINHNFIRSVPLVIHFEEKIARIQKNFQISPQIAFNFSSFYRISYVFFWKPARGNSSGTLPLMWGSEIRRNEFRYIVSRDDESVASSPELFSGSAQYTQHRTDCVTSFDILNQFYSLYRFWVVFSARLLPRLIPSL